MNNDLPTSTITVGPSWGNLAAQLLTVEKDKSWAKTHSSFSSWLVDQAKSLHRSEATVWRALSAGRYYTELQEECLGRGIESPDLGSPLLAATPEALELAQKISRVAPDDVVQQISRKVISGGISRRELRTYWDTYRPVLNGLTARGRNVDAPRFNPRSAEMFSSRMEADCIAGLIQDGSAWLGSANAHIYKVIPVTDQIASRLGSRCVPDVIVLFQSEPNQPLELHGIETATRLENNAAVRHYRTQGLGVDYFWVTTPSEGELRLLDHDLEIGILEANPSSVKVIRRAGPARLDSSQALTLMRGLLAREVVA